MGEIIFWLALAGAFIYLVNLYAKRSHAGGQPNIPPYVPPSPLPFPDSNPPEGKKLPIDDNEDKGIA